MDSSEIFTKLVEYVKTDVVENRKCSTITATEFYEGFKQKFTLGKLQEMAASAVKPTILTLLNVFFDIPSEKSYIFSTKPEQKAPEENKKEIITICNDPGLTNKEKPLKIVNFIMTTLFNKLQKSEPGKENNLFDQTLRTKIGDKISDGIIQLYYEWLNTVVPSLLGGGRRKQSKKSRTNKYRTNKYRTKKSRTKKSRKYKL